MQKCSYVFDSPIGKLFLAESDGALSDLSFCPVSNSIYKETPILALTAQMLREYFDGQRREFDIELNLEGTEFQVRAWNALCTIPYGETRSYKEQAATVGNAKAFRAVGAANRKNPISIIVPCHRVIGSSGALVGYGCGLDKKQALLCLEREFSALNR